MSNFKPRVLTKKGSITFHDTEGVVHYDKGEQVRSAADFKAIPQRQQAFFTKAETEDEDEGKAEDLTVEQLQDALEEAEVDYPSDARKADLVELYLEHVEQG